MEQKVFQLIESKREGAYWDFKEKHHDNKATLLHDILSLANAFTKSNKYLIYGVSDPSSGCEVKGVEPEGRRTQTDIIDFLRSKKFAGDNRPEVELRTLNSHDKQIDVLVIFDHPKKPYYLSEDYRDQLKHIRANYIYTRSLDTNTPIDKSADIWVVEEMWRERFGLDLQPAKRMVELLNRPSEWDKDVGNKEFAYHKYHPEFQVQFGEPKEFKNVYSYFYINERSFIGAAYFRYLTTELFSLPYIYCDEMRVELADPTNGWVRSEGRELWYMYYELDSRQGAFLNFITNGSFDFNSRMSMSAFVMYRDEAERKEFESYLEKNLDKFDAIPDSELGLMMQKRIYDSGENFIFKPIEMIKVVELFDSWRANKA